MTTESLGQIDRLHQADMVRLLVELGPCTRAALAAHMGMGRTTVSQVLMPLVASGVVEIGARQTAAGRGRPAQTLRLNTDAVVSIGIDFGHSWVQVGALNVVGKRLVSQGRTLPGGEDWTLRAEVLDELLEATGLAQADSETLFGLAVGLPGPVHIDEQWIVDNAVASRRRDASEHYDGAAWLGLVQDLSRRFDVPVLIDNTSRLAALAEHAAAGGTAHQSTFYVRCFAGIGGALADDRGVWRGSRGMAGELGHLQVDPHGRRCRCGRLGCLETVATVGGLASALAADGEAPVSPSAFLEALGRNEPAAVRAVRRGGSALGHVLAQVTLLTDPTRIVVSGELSTACPDFLEEARATLGRELGEAFSAPTVVAGRFGTEAAALGGALTVLRQHLPQPWAD